MGVELPARRALLFNWRTAGVSRPVKSGAITGRLTPAVRLWNLRESGLAAISPADRRRGGIDQRFHAARCVSATAGRRGVRAIGEALRPTGLARLQESDPLRCRRGRCLSGDVSRAGPERRQDRQTGKTRLMAARRGLPGLFKSTKRSRSANKTGTSRG